MLYIPWCRLQNSWPKTVCGQSRDYDVIPQLSITQPRLTNPRGFKLHVASADFAKIGLVFK